MVEKYKVVTLCGSPRFKHEFMEAQKRMVFLSRRISVDV